MGGGEVPGNDNWYWQFSTSIDLRADIRKRIAPDAYRDSGEKLVKSGLAPILVVMGQGIQKISNGKGKNGFMLRFTLTLANAGSLPAINACSRIEIENVGVYGGAGANLGIVVSGDDPANRGARTAGIEIDEQLVADALDKDTKQRKELPVWFIVGYTVPSGHVMEDRTLLIINRQNGELVPATSPTYYGKKVTEMRSFISKEG